MAGLKNYVQRDPQSWDKSVAAMCSAHNPSCHENTGVLPHFLLTGRNLQWPSDLITVKPGFMPTTNATTDLQHINTWCMKWSKQDWKREKIR